MGVYHFIAARTNFPLYFIGSIPSSIRLRIAFCKTTLHDDTPPLFCCVSGPCRLSIPVVKEVMKQYIGQIDVVEICTDDLPEVASDAGVLSIPTIHLLYRGELMDTIIGCVAKGVLASAVEKVLEDTVLNNKSK